VLAMTLRLLLKNNSRRSSRIDQRTTRHAGYRLSQYARKLIETVFGDAKQHGILRQVKLRGLRKVGSILSAETMKNSRSSTNCKSSTPDFVIWCDSSPGGKAC